MRKRWSGVGGLVAAALVLTACGGGGDGKASSASDSGKPSGEITVLTNRTDLVDTTFKDYAATFEKKYPDVKVKFEAITDYEGEVKIRLNTKDYGDVLLIPNAISPSQYADFFTPLGTVDELKGKYRFVQTEGTDKGKVYGLAQVGNAMGFVYNKNVWQQAGVTKDPTTPDEFLADLKAVKAKTGAIPYYTNYKDGWPLTQWTSGLASVDGDPNVNNALASDKAPWTAGKPLAVMDTLIYDIVQQKLSEPDPTTTNWEQSKGLLANGKISSMYLGSWAISQMQDAAKKAGTDPSEIGFMPFPAQVDGKFVSPVSGDYKVAVSRYSEHQAAARAWLDWFIDDSGYAASQGGVPTLKTGAMPDSLADFSKLGVDYLELAPAPAGKEGLLSDVDKASEVGIYQPDYRQEIVDAARGAKKESLDQIFTKLNGKWAQGVQTASS